MQRQNSKQTPEISWIFKTQTNTFLVLILIDKYKDQDEKKTSLYTYYVH